MQPKGQVDMSHAHATNSSREKTNSRPEELYSSSALLDMDADIRVNSSESSFAEGVFDSDETAKAWESLEQRLRARLRQSSISTV